MSATTDPGEFEIKYDKGDVEGGYGGEWHQHLSAGTHSFEFTAPESGCEELVLRFPMGNSPAPNTITVSNISVQKWVPEHDEPTDGTTTPGSFSLWANTESGAAATLSGTGYSAIATVDASTGTDWHIKLYANTLVQLQEGKTYRIDMNVSGAGGWLVNYKRTGDQFENDFNGEMSFGGPISNIVTPSVTGNLEIVLQLGKLVKDESITVSDIAITEIGADTEGENLAPSTLSDVTYWAHEDYAKGDAGSVTAQDSSAAVEIKAPPAEGRESWKFKFFVNTGIALTAGKTYRISADVVSTADVDYEICYNNGLNGAGENALGNKGGLHASTTSQTVVYDTTPDADATLTLQLNLGNAATPCTVTVSNVKVEEMKEGAGESVLPSFSYDSVGSIDSTADAGYLVELEKGGSSATIRILQAPDDRNPWNVKLNVNTGFTPEKGKGYRVSFDVDSEKTQNSFEVFYDGGSEAAYGQLTGQSLPAGKKTVTYLIQPGDSKGVLSLQLRFGRTDGTDGNSYTVSNVKIEEVDFETRKTQEISEVATLWTHEDYQAALEKKPAQLTVSVGKTPAANLEPWKTKLFIDTGVTLEAGEKYRISLDVWADAETGFEICYNRDEEEKGLGAQYGLTAYPETRTFEYTAYAGRDTHLIIQLSLGNCSAPNAIHVSHIRVEKAGESEQVSQREYWFPQLLAEANHGSGDGTLRITGDTMTYYMTVISAKEGDNKIAVASLPLAEDQSYTISFRARADKPLGCQFVLNRAGAWDTAVYEDLALTEQWQEFRFSIPAGQLQNADYELLWQFGSAENAEQGSAVAEIADLTIKPD